MSPSPTENAPTNLEELKELLKNDNKVKVAGVDVEGVLRGKIMSKAKLLSSVKSEGFNFCSVIFGWDIHDQAYNKELLVANWDNGYRDLFAIIDLSTFRRLKWEKDIPFFLCRFVIPETGEILPVDPRSLIAKVTDKGKDMGYKCMSGAEFEYFQFAETTKTLADKNFRNLNPLTPGMHGYSILRPTLNMDYFHDLYDMAVDFGIEVEGHHTETGPGVFETALGYTDASRMADNACLFKLVAKSIGMKYGISPTFMAKPWGDLPGCSGHIHVSLQDKNGKNIFAVSDEEAANGGRKDAAFEDAKYLSQEGEWFLAGLLEGMPDVVPMFCPTINSYKRLQGGQAMWAPDTATWGYDSRAASVRLLTAPGVPGYATRFEVRVPGADMNPYFAMSAIFALGLRGIEQKRALPYGPIGSPGVSRDTVKHLPTSLDNATEAFMKKDSLAREVFGNFFVDHYGGTREHEVELHKKAVTDWEVARYFELV
ncbi:glutamine synthetase [Cryptococcus neoformans Tu401-1]|nr:glutamine synthetase [Cryptococcus neoformans var. grubii Tu401-1]